MGGQSHHDPGDIPVSVYGLSRRFNCGDSPHGFVVLGQRNHDSALVIRCLPFVQRIFGHRCDANSTGAGVSCD